MASKNLNAGCGYAFTSVFALAGLGMMTAAWLGSVEGGAKDRWIVAAVGAVFFAAGLGLTLAVRAGARRAAATAALAVLHPNEPWKWRPEWNAGRIKAGTEAHPVVMWLFALASCGGGFTAAVAVTPRALRGEEALYLVYFMPAVGLLIAWGAVHATIKARKFGRAAFLPASVPGEIGGYLGGVIQVPARLELEADMVLRLESIRRVVTGSGKNRSVQEHTLWESEARVAREKWRGGTQSAEIPVLFHIPPGCEPTEVTEGDNRVLWRLRAEAKVPGVDFSARFEVPVFSTGRTAEPPQAGVPLMPEYLAGPPSADALSSAGVRTVADLKAFEFTTQQIAGAKVVLGFFTAGTTAAIGILAWKGYWFPAVMLLLVDAFMWLVLADMFAIGSLRIEGAEVVVTRRGFGRTRETRVRRDEIAGIRTRRSMKTGNNQFYRLILVGSPGVDPKVPGAGEPFAVRKLRHQLARAMKELGIADATQGGERTALIVNALREAPRFEIEVGGYIPGLASAEAVGALLMERIRGGRN